MALAFQARVHIFVFVLEAGLEIIANMLLLIHVILIIIKLNFKLNKGKNK